MMNAIGGWSIASAGVAIVGIAAFATMTIRNPGDETLGTRTHAEVRTYGEQVFRLQNLVLDELINASLDESGLPAKDEEMLLAAEDVIVDSCRDLNDAAVLAAEGREPGIQLQLRVLDSMTRCEASAVAAKGLLAGRAGFSSAATQ